MALAYGAVLTLIDLIDRIPAHHARYPTLFSEIQLQEIESIKEKACFIQNYLEVHSLGLDDSNEALDLKRRIIEVSVEATKTIETHILDDIEKMNTFSSMDTLSIQFKDEFIEETSCRCFSFSKKKSKKNMCASMDSVIKEMMKIDDLQPNNLKSTHSSSIITHTTIYDRDTVVGLDDRLFQIMDKLTGLQPALQIIPITGMGGIGKSTLAQTIYDNSLIVQSFDIRGWVTISQVYDIKQVLLKLLRGFGIVEQENSEYAYLGQILHKHLFGRKYLIIVDDLWNTEAWDKLRRFLPDTKGSRIIVTTRLNEVANYVGSDKNLHEINLLDENESWRLLCLKIFGQNSCPLELEQVGKRIVKGCKGLPLAIVVIGGLLTKSVMTIDFWEYVADNVNKIISSKDNDCSDILLLSYKHLPIHLRLCFLYSLSEDISVSELVNLWVAEGFLKPNKLKTLEDVAYECLRDLTERHLVMINYNGRSGKKKSCKVHDLLRDLCRREAAKEGSVSVNGKTILISKVVFRSIWQHAYPSIFDDIPNRRFRRVLNGSFYSNEGYIDLLNLRFLCIKYFVTTPEKFSLVHRLWNLQTLVLFSQGEVEDLKLPIWKMPYLRHFIFRPRHQYICIDEPRVGDYVLENLQTLKGVYVNFDIFEEVFSRIPNVKVLVMKCDAGLGGEYYFKSYGHLLKLESLTLQLKNTLRGNFIGNSVFPDSLKKLHLIQPDCSLDEISKRIGWLPCLQKLTLRYANTEEEWNPIEGQFLHLKILKFDFCFNLVHWNAESAHFPNLEHLHLGNMFRLEEIPCDIGEIETLKSISLFRCKDSVVDSAKEILEEQKSNGNEDFHLYFDK